MSDGFGFQISHFCEFLRVFENVLFPLGSDKAAECFNVAPSRRGLVCRTPKPKHKLWVKKSRIQWEYLNSVVMQMLRGMCNRSHRDEMRVSKINFYLPYQSPFV